MRSVKKGAWTDPTVWDSGQVPTADKFVEIAHVVTFKGTADCAGVHVLPGGSLNFEGNKSATLRSSKNVHVEGTFVMWSTDPTIKQTLVFTEVDENDYVGGGMDVLDSDVGLWFTGAGKWVAIGAARRRWTNLVGGTVAGASKIIVQDASGWMVGDDLAIAPTEPTTVGSPQFHTYEKRKIAAKNGNEITLDKPLTYAHPIAYGYTAEVVNRTSNVNVQGTEEGRAHIAFMHATNPPVIANIGLRRLGPRQPDDEHPMLGVIGRYPLHFHHCDEAMRGTVIDSVIADGCGNHAFVPHGTHGMTWLRCAAVGTDDDPFWWDKGHATNDNLWDTCIAMGVASSTRNGGYRIAGFKLGSGMSSVHNCVATAVGGWAQTSGYHWPENDEGTWDYQSNIAHNNKIDGNFTWQNTVLPHEVHNAIAYHNGDAGIDHGAYRTSYRWSDGFLGGNGKVGIRLHAAARLINGVPQTFQDIQIEKSRVAFQSTFHRVAGTVATDLLRLSIKNCTFAFVFAAEGSTQVDNPELYYIEGTVWQAGVGTRYQVSDAVAAESLIEVHDADHDMKLRRKDQLPGVYVREWNASVEDL